MAGRVFASEHRCALLVVEHSARSWQRFPISWELQLHTGGRGLQLLQNVGRGAGVCAGPVHGGMDVDSFGAGAIGPRRGRGRRLLRGWKSGSWQGSV